MGFTYRQISEDYAKAFQGETVSHLQIAKVAKRRNWKKDLTEQYEKTVERKVIEKATKGETSLSGPSMWRALTTRIGNLNLPPKS